GQVSPGSGVGPPGPARPRPAAIIRAVSGVRMPGGYYRAAAAAPRMGQTTRARYERPMADCLARETMPGVPERARRDRAACFGGTPRAIAPARAAVDRSTLRP